MAQSLEGDFNPSVHFLGLLKKALNDGIARRCSLAGGPQIVVAPREMTYYGASVTDLDLRALCVAEPFDLQIEPLPNWDPDAGKENIQVGRMFLRTPKSNAAVKGLTPRPLAQLLWLATLHVSGGRLLQGCRADDPVRLKRMPDFSVLPHREHHLRLARFMSESGAELTVVAKRTGIALEQVFDFHNACVLLGLIERGNVFEPDEYFLGLLQKAQRDGLTRRCLMPGLPPLFLAPKEGRYYAPAGGETDLSAFYCANVDQLQVETLDALDTGEEEEEVIQIGRMMVRRKRETPRLAAGAMDELLWNAALHASRGRLLAGKRSGDVVRLRRWPDFSRLCKDRRWLPLAAFMSVNAADLLDVAKHTGVPLARVVDFHNACAVLGYLEYPQDRSLQRRTVSETERATFRNIAKSLKKAAAGEYGRQ